MGLEPNRLRPLSFRCPNNYDPHYLSKHGLKGIVDILSPFPSKVRSLLQNRNIQKWRKRFHSSLDVTCIDPMGLCLVLGLTGARAGNGGSRMDGVSIHIDAEILSCVTDTLGARKEGVYCYCYYFLIEHLKARNS